MPRIKYSNGICFMIIAQILRKLETFYFFKNVGFMATYLTWK